MKFFFWNIWLLIVKLHTCFQCWKCTYKIPLHSHSTFVTFTKYYLQVLWTKNDSLVFPLLSDLKGYLPMINAETLVKQISHTYVGTSSHVFLECSLLILCLLSAPSSAPCRLWRSYRGRESVGLKVDFLLKDSCENELSSDNRERCRNCRATQQPVLLAGNNYSMRLRESNVAQN